MHDGGVVGVQHVLADPIAGHLAERLQPAGQLHRIATGHERGQVEDVDADVSQHAGAAMGGGHPPQPGRVGSPVAPGGLHQPALQVGRLEVAHRTDVPGRHHRLRGGERGYRAVAQVDRVHETGSRGHLGHLPCQGVFRCEGLFAQHVLAGAQQGKRCGVVHRIRRDVRGGVESAPGERLVEACEPALDAVLDQVGGQRVRPVVHRGDHARTGHGRVLARVLAGPVAGAQDQHPHRRCARRRGSRARRIRHRHRHRNPCSPCACSFGPRSSIGSGARSTGTFGASATSAGRGAGSCAQRTALTMTRCTLASW